MAEEKNYHNEIIKRYKHFKKRQLPQEQGEQIWEQLRHVIDEEDQHSIPPRRRWYRNTILPIAASVAAVAVVAVGIPLGHRLISTNQDATQTSPVLSPMQPLEVVTSNWRAVLSRCLKPGTQYQINIYYNGQGGVPLSSVIINWGNGTFNAAKDFKPVPTQDLKHGAMVTGETDLTFKNGLESVKPLKITWKEHGVRHHETLNFLQAKADIKVRNDYSYYGEDSKWNVSLEYETLTAPGFQKWNSNVVVTKKQGLTQSAELTLKSNLGKYNWGYQTTPGQKTFEMGLPNEKITHITQPTVEMVIADGAQSDTVTLKRQNSPST